MLPKQVNFNALICVSTSFFVSAISRDIPETHKVDGRPDIPPGVPKWGICSDQ